jgi:DNA-binding response OmpR family regulator
MKLRVRVADDEELIRKSLTKLLTAEGYQVDSVASAGEAEHGAPTRRTC